MDELLDAANRCGMHIQQLEAENARLKDFAQYVLDHTWQTCNVGVVMGNTSPETLRLKAEQALY